MYIDMCIDMCLDICIDMCIAMCIDMCILFDVEGPFELLHVDPRKFGNVPVFRHVFRHVFQTCVHVKTELYRPYLSR